MINYLKVEDYVIPKHSLIVELHTEVCHCHISSPSIGVPPHQICIYCHLNGTSYLSVASVAGVECTTINELLSLNSVRSTPSRKQTRGVSLQQYQPTILVENLHLNQQKVRNKRMRLLKIQIESTFFCIKKSSFAGLS